MSRKKKRRGQIVLALFPATKGVGYAVFDGPQSLVDWGVKIVRGLRKSTRSLDKAGDLIAIYRPDVLVLEDCRGEASRRSTRIEDLIEAISRQAETDGIATRRFSRGDIRQYSSRFGAWNKDQIAQVIVSIFPELEPWLPPTRRIWMSEDSRMSIFDAVALGMTFFHSEQPRKRLM